MVSQMAIEDIEELISEGLKPTPEDIIKLNALAVKYEAAQGKIAGYDVYQLPRVAYLSEKIWLRQPTIGHDIWIDQIGRFINKNDFDTMIAIKTYALSRDNTELPNPDSPDSIVKALTEFKEQMKDFHKDQIFKALQYVIFGSSDIDNEYPEEKPSVDSDKEEDEEDWNRCVAIGILRDGIALQLGLTLNELKSMTRRELEYVKSGVLILNHIDTTCSSKVELGRYYKTLDIIRERLLKNKDKQ